MQHENSIQIFISEAKTAEPRNKNLLRVVCLRPILTRWFLGHWTLRLKHSRIEEFWHSTTRLSRGRVHSLPTLPVNALQLVYTSLAKRLNGRMPSLHSDREYNVPRSIETLRNILGTTSERASQNRGSFLEQHGFPDEKMSATKERGARPIKLRSYTRILAHSFKPYELPTHLWLGIWGERV